MIFYVVGMCVYGVFDFLELFEVKGEGAGTRTMARTWEKILFGIVFAAALGLGIYYIAAHESPSLTRGLIDYFNLRNIRY